MLFSYSSSRLMGNRSELVRIWLFRMKSAYRNCEKKCGVPLASLNVALVMPFAEKAHGGTVGNPEPLPQPGPSPGTCRPPVVVVACTAKALAWRMESGLFHLMAMKVGIVVSRPSWSFADTCPPSE